MARSFLITLSVPFLFSIISVSFLSCKKSKPEEIQDTVFQKFVIKPDITYQEMVGFGGALTWYSNNIINSPKKEEIYNLMFSDLGLDILRLKNWYYPTEYPANKSADNMSSGDKTMLNASRTFFDKARSINPNIKVLFSSWGPPAGLKSNNALNEGTLKKNTNGTYMYDEFAQYWVDVLDNIGFNPDYISIQNECSYSNAGWTTCVWSPVENSSAAAYSIAFSKVYDKIRNRAFVPVMVGTEAENLQALDNFVPTVRNLDYCPIYAFHPYNFNESSDFTSISTALTNFSSQYGDKPNFMTEYSGMSWFKTARFIQQTLQYANTSAYLYWELVWGDAKQSMISVDAAGNYTLTPFYYLLKHFARYIDYGYKRIDVTTSQNGVEVTAFINPEKSVITLIAINTGYSVASFKFDVGGYTIAGVNAYQSIEGKYFSDLGAINADGAVALAAKSITTIVLHLKK